MEGGVELPEPIIQHILSFLTGREGARTTILSKAWHHAWHTLPHLVLDETVFVAQGENKDSEFLKFSKYVKNIIVLYEQSNLKIESLDLCMRACDDASSFVKSLLKLGATRLILELIGDDHVVFPHDVLFGEKNNLVELSVHGNFENCAMPVGLTNTNFDRLRCLELCYGSFESLFPGDLLSKFPLLTDFTILLERRLLDYRFPLVPQVQITSRSLERVKVLLSGRAVYEFDVCRVRLKLDVLNIRSFTFQSSCGVFPSLSVVSCFTTREWESHVCVTHDRGLTADWFGVLSKFLAKLRQSKIHLSLQVECPKGFDYVLGDVESFVVRKHELENLTIDTTGMPSFFCYDLFDGLFRFCRPKIITLDREKEYYGGGQDPGQGKMMFDVLCELIDQGIRLKVSDDPGPFVYDSLCDLEEANAQVFDDDDEQMGWRPPIPLKSLLDDQGQQQRVRLLLKWKP